MGKNSNVHKRQSFHEADLQREREEEQRRAAKKEKMQAKALKQVLEPKPAPMEVERNKRLKHKKERPGPARDRALGRSGSKLAGVKKSKTKRSTAVHKRQLIRAAKAKEMDF